MSISEQQIKEVFSKFDTDGSGEISISELLNLLRQLYAGKSDNDIKAIAHKCLKDCDKNDDSRISFEEFKTFVKNL